jgi:hypothetical protein
VHELATGSKTYEYPAITSIVSGHLALTCPTICAINVLPALEPPTRNPGMSAGYSIPWTATFAAPPIIAPTAETKGGPATLPMLPGSVVPRAKRMVMALQAPPPVTSFWDAERRAAEANDATSGRAATGFMATGR